MHTVVAFPQIDSLDIERLVPTPAALLISFQETIAEAARYGVVPPQESVHQIAEVFNRWDLGGSYARWRAQDFDPASYYASSVRCAVAVVREQLYAITLATLKGRCSHV